MLSGTGIGLLRFELSQMKNCGGGGLQAGEDEEVMEKRRTRVINALALPPFRAW